MAHQKRGGGQVRLYIIDLNSDSEYGYTFSEQPGTGRNMKVMEL